MIHLITTMNQPCLHFEFNEAWILSGNEPDPDAGDMEWCALTRPGSPLFRPSR